MRSAVPLVIEKRPHTVAAYINLRLFDIDTHCPFRQLKDIQPKLLHEAVRDLLDGAFLKPTFVGPINRTFICSVWAV